MADINDQNNPLARASIYQKLGINPFASTSEIKDKLNRLSKEELEALESEFPSELQYLDAPAKRVMINALLLDPVNSRHIIDLLSSLPGNLRDEDLHMPQIDVKHIIKEGESVDIAKQDFRDIEKDPELEIDMSVIESLLKNKTETKVIKFDS